MLNTPLQGEFIVAITQISQITQRKGLQVDLPRLAGAEFGWSVDSRRLFIGNGDLEEGAPVIGNTEVLTEFSDILKVNATYTYEGESTGYIAQTGPNIDSPVTMSLQQWMDQWVSVKDFGAKGDGFTDDTAAINRALYQIYCRDVNPQVRKSIYFPAGVYKVTSAIKVPPYATLYGDGAENSIIQMAYNSVEPYVFVTADSNQQTGVNIGSNGAIPPQNVTIFNMCIASKTSNSNLCLLDSVSVIRFQSVGFRGPLVNNEISSDVARMAAIRFRSNESLITNSVTIDNCQFSGLTYATNTDDYETGDNSVVRGVTINGSKLSNLYQGIKIGSNTFTNDITGFRITSNVFDSIYAEGIVIGKVRINASAYNFFYDVGNYLLGIENPYTAIIEFKNGDNISVGDLFTRETVDPGSVLPGTSIPCILTNNTTSISVMSDQVEVGTYIRRPGSIATLADNTSVETTVISEYGEPLVINTLDIDTFSINYSIIRGSVYRTGTISVSANGAINPEPTWSDDYTENQPSGVNLVVKQAGEVLSVMYTTSFNFIDATFSYSIQTFNY